MRLCKQGWCRAGAGEPAVLESLEGWYYCSAKLRSSCALYH
jgi:hypothetical protein